MTDNEIIADFKKVTEYSGFTDDVRNTLKLTLDFIKRLQAENDDLLYKLTGVMHSVDKWLDGDELKQDEVNRAATMREKTLRLIESAKDEAMTEFADRLQLRCIKQDGCLWSSDIGAELKEMIGEE